jgi:pimeloyl-ACP methyl ester carboxylesterase
MTVPEYYPYRSASARDSCFAYLDSLAARQWPVVSEQRTFPTRFGETFVRITGPASAPPLVLLHGAASTSLMWAPNVQALSSSYRTFAVDQIGEFGRSICTTPVQSLHDLLAWLDDLFEALNLRNSLSIVGISYGGALAAQYALHFPARLSKIVLLAPGNTVLRVTTEFMARTVLAAIATRRWLPSFLRWIFPDVARKNPEWVDGIIEQSFLNFRSLQRRKIIIPPVLTDAEWASLSVPALFLVGEHEVIYSPKKAVARLNRVAPNMRTEIIRGAGHDLTVAEADVVNRRIIDFLNANPAQHPGNTPAMFSLPAR